MARSFFFIVRFDSFVHRMGKTAFAQWQPSPVGFPLNRYKSCSFANSEVAGFPTIYDSLPLPPADNAFS